MTEAAQNPKSVGTYEPLGANVIFMYLQRGHVFRLELDLCASLHHQRIVFKASKQKYCKCLLSTRKTIFLTEVSSKKPEKWVAASTIKLWVKRNCLKCVIMVVFTIQIFAIGIKIWGMSCKPDCVHIKKNVNQRAAGLNHSLLRSVKICDKATKDYGLFLFPSFSFPFNTEKEHAAHWAV